MKDYGERLVAALEARGRDRADLARELKISVQAVGQVINGNTKMFDALNHVSACRYLSVDPVWLASGEGSMDGFSGLDRHIVTMLNLLPESEKARAAGYIDSLVEAAQKEA